MKSYSVLAKYYDRFSQNDCDYTAWSQYLSTLANCHGAKSVVDIACGTGKMTELLAKMGFSLVGVDSSVEMLNLATAKCPRATFVLQDMEKLSLQRRFDMAIAVNDAVNYVPPQRLAPFFAKVADSLASGAPFVFDISSPRKLRDILDGNVFFVDEEDATLLWTNELSANKLKMSLTLFEKVKDDVYRRCDETHTQYVHTRQAVEAALSEHFCLREVTSDYGKAACDDSLRLTFYAVAR